MQADSGYFSNILWSKDKNGYPKGTCVGYNVATHLHSSFALTDLQPDRISVRYHRYPTQKLIDVISRFTARAANVIRLVVL